MKTQFILRFGKHKGQCFWKVPANYRQWLCKQDWFTPPKDYNPNYYKENPKEQGDPVQAAERRMEQSAELRMAGISQDEYDYGDPYDEDYRH
jgi:hypothetical protein